MEWQPAVDPLHWDKSAAGVGTHDGIHFDTKSVRIFAERYAAAYLKMTAGKP